MSLANDGPGDAKRVHISFEAGPGPLSHSRLDYDVVHAGATIWVGSFAPASQLFARDAVRVDWANGPDEGWVTQIRE